MSLIRKSIVCLALSAAAAVQAAPLLLDTYEDDTVGAAPNGPEVGNASYGTGILVGTPIGSFGVVDVGGNRRLEVSTNGTAGSPDNGTIIEFNPLAGPSQRLGVHYQFQVQPGGSAVGLNAWMQEIILNPFGTNLALFWPQAGSNWTVGWTTPGGGGFSQIDLGVAYTLGTLHTVDWTIDFDADLFSLQIDGNPLLSNQSIGVDLQSIRQLAMLNNFSTSGSVLIDNVRIEAATVPEPATIGLALVAALGALASRGRSPTQSPTSLARRSNPNS